MDYSSLAVVLGLHVVPLGFWLSYYWSRDKEHPEKLLYVALTLLSGMGAAAIIPFLQWYVPGLIGIFLGMPQVLQSSMLTTVPPLLFVVLSAGLEEVLKHLAAIQIMFRIPSARDELSDGLLYPVTAALGFSFVENIVYALYKTDVLDVSMMLMRGSITMFSHTAFSAVFGCIYVVMRRKLGTSATRTYVPVAVQYMRRFWKREAFVVVSPMDIVVEGLIAATLLHTIYNILLEGVGTVTGSVLIIGYILLLLLLTTWVYLQSAKTSTRP